MFPQILAASGFFQYGVVYTRDIPFSQEVRTMCQVNSCGKYGTTWACPPAMGSVEQCKARICRFDQMLVFTGKYDLEDSFDFEGMISGARAFSEACHRFDRAIRPHISDYLIFSNEGCDLCPSCTYPAAPCRFPDLMHASLEGNGILVSELAKLAGIRYQNGPNTVTYFGAMVCPGSVLNGIERLTIKSQASK